MVKSVLFVCLGNICRSPMADAIFQNLLKEGGGDDLEEWVVDSAAIGTWHLGKQPDDRTLRVLEAHGIVYRHKVRQVTSEDFNKFDYIFGMDEDNMSALDDIAPKKPYKAKVALLGSFDPEKILYVHDPYYDNGEKGFFICYDHCHRCLQSFMKTLS